MQTLDSSAAGDVHDNGHSDPGAATIDQAVENVLKALTDAWHEGNAERFAKPFASNARFVAFDGTVLTGPGEIAGYHREPFATYLAGTMLNIGKIEISSIGNAVWMVASEGGIERGGHAEGELIGRSAQTFVFKCTGNRLEIAAFQNTRVRPIDGPGAADAWRRFDEDWSKRSRQ